MLGDLNPQRCHRRAIVRPDLQRLGLRSWVFEPEEGHVHLRGVALDLARPAAVRQAQFVRLERDVSDVAILEHAHHHLFVVLLRVVNLPG